MKTRITKAPGDPTSDTPDWVCITNQRINPFSNRTHQDRETPEVKAFRVRKKVMIEAGYVTTGQAAKISGYALEQIRYIVLSKQIDAMMVDRVWWIGRNAMEELMARRRQYEKVYMRQGMSKS